MCGEEGEEGRYASVWEEGEEGRCASVWGGGRTGKVCKCVGRRGRREKREGVQMCGEEGEEGRCGMHVKQQLGT